MPVYYAVTKESYFAGDDTHIDNNWNLRYQSNILLFSSSDKAKKYALSKAELFKIKCDPSFPPNPNGTHKCKVPIIFKIYLHDDKVIKCNHAIKLAGCVGILPKMTFPENPLHVNRLDSKFSADNNILLIHESHGDNIYIPKSRSYPSTYYQLMQRACSAEKHMKDVSALLQDYYRTPFKRFITGHVLRHHSDRAKKLHIAIEQASNPSEVFELLVEERASLAKSLGVNIKGSYLSRLNYAIECFIQCGNLTPFTRINTAMHSYG